MTSYRLTWITENLALGHAPMSHGELDAIWDHGIRAILNLCAEFCDLHEIEGTHGFEVYYLPIHDDDAPSMIELEEALEWLDEAIYLGKKVLVHCRQGIGRTGTFATAYLLRKGFSLKMARKRIERTKAGFTSFQQWRALKKFGKRSGILSIREPTLEKRHLVDLTPFFLDYEAILDQIDDSHARASMQNRALLRCGMETDVCCFRPLHLELIEAAYLSNQMNKTLDREERKAAIERAVAAGNARRGIGRQDGVGSKRVRCPLNMERKCILFDARPTSCRLYVPERRTKGDVDLTVGTAGAAKMVELGLDVDEIHRLLVTISRHILLALSSSFPPEKKLTFSLEDTISGKYVQQYFVYLSDGK